MAKRKQKPKKGSVLRVGEELSDYLSTQRKNGETWDMVVRRVIGVPINGPVKVTHMWTLPSKLIPTKSEALGIALAETVLNRKKIGEREDPIKVFSR